MELRIAVDLSSVFLSLTLALPFPAVMGVQGPNGNNLLLKHHLVTVSPTLDVLPHHSETQTFLEIWNYSCLTGCGNSIERSAMTVDELYAAQPPHTPVCPFPRHDLPRRQVLPETPTSAIALHHRHGETPRHSKVQESQNGSYHLSDGLPHSPNVKFTGGSTTSSRH